MGAEFTPVFLLLIVAIAIGVGMLVGRLSWRQARRPGSSKCRMNREWTRSVTPDSDSIFVFTWSPSFSCFSTSSYCSSTLGPSPSGVPASRPGTMAGIPAEFRGWVFWEIMVFIMILAAAFAYAWRKGVFEWR